MGKRIVLLVCSFLLTLAALTQSLAAGSARNVILMIADGWGYNQIKATNYFTGTTPVYQAFPVTYAVSTYPLTRNLTPTGSGIQNQSLVYDSAKAWDAVKGREFLTSTYTDSAAAITAMMTGQKTYNNAINWSDTNQPIHTTIAERFKAANRAVGAATTVEWSHATPAGAYAHNISRRNYSDIANEGIHSRVDVIMGAGNPDFDENGHTASQMDAKYVGGAASWESLRGGKIPGIHHIQTRQEFQALASGKPAGRYIGTLQARSLDRQPCAPGNHGPSVPTLSEMALGALNVLSSNPNGFFLMVEGGAVDFASHEGRKDLMIQEMVDFNSATKSVCNWIEAHGGWDETLLIVTGDHETGLLWGPSGPFSEIANNGVGVMPGMQYNSWDPAKKEFSHSNSLVPIFAKGVGSAKFSEYAKGHDQGLADHQKSVSSGYYLDNTSIYRVILRAAGIPEPVAINNSTGIGQPAYQGAR